MTAETLPPLKAPPPSIALECIRLVRGRVRIFDNLSLSLTQHRIGLIGNNGAGKSSLFRLICELDIPQSGEVRLPISQRGERPVGMMFQNGDEQIIFPTVEEELALSLNHLDLSRSAAIEQARRWLTQQGLADWALKPVGSLSQGQRQRVCWLSLLLAEHQVLLLDEPFASLDLPSQARLSRDLAHAKQQIILSTHQLDHVRHFERVIWLHEGQIRADGPGHEVCHAYETDLQAQMLAQDGA